MEKINFQPIFDYIDEKLGEQSELLRSELATKEDVRRIQDTLDSFAKDYERHGENLMLLEHKFGRLEKWVFRAAKKTDIPYEV